MRKIIILVAMATMLAIPHDALARTQKIDMGQFKITAYCPCYECSDGYGRHTHSGKTAKSGRTIAVDQDVIDIGSKVKIGKKTYIAEDVGGKVIGDTIDIFFDTHEEVEEYEVKYKHVWVVRK